MFTCCKGCLFPDTCVGLALGFGLVICLRCGCDFVFWIPVIGVLCGFGDCVHLWSLFCVLFYFKFGNFSVLLDGLFIVGFGVWLVCYFEIAVWIWA